MENSLIGAISAGVVCGVLFCITIAIICFLCYRCRRYEDEKTSQHDLLINGHVPNGHIPTVTQLVPVPGPSRQLYQFPTMPVRHMASYRPRYIEERNPDGAPKMEGHGVAVKSQTYNGPYTTSKGPVFYDVRQHGDYRSNRSPVWAQKAQEEAVATMNLGEESPKSERHFVLEENNNRASVKSNSEHTIVGSRSSRTEELKIPSPDASRREYLFTTELEQENSPSSSQPANDKTHDIYAVARKESANGVRREVRRESTRRQRRGEEGQRRYRLSETKRYRLGEIVLTVDFAQCPDIINYMTSQCFDIINDVRAPSVSKHRSSHHRSTPVPQDFDGAVYIFSATPETILEDSHAQVNQQPVERYFINDDLYTVSSNVSKSSPKEHDLSSSYSALHVIGRPVSIPDANDVSHKSHGMMDGQIHSTNQLPPGNYVQGPTVAPSVQEPDHFTMNNQREQHQIDYRVIKSKRRPSWLQNASQWFSKGKKSK